jgi:hypothetical protein
MLVIPLETNESFYISDIDKMRYYDNKFFVFDEVRSKKLLCFGKDGKFLYQVGTVGKAEGEYITPRDININPWKKRIELYDIMNNKILFYDFQGRYIGYSKFGRKARAIALVDSISYAVFNDGEYNDLPFNLFVTPIDSFKVQRPGIPFQGQRDVMNGVNSFSDFGPNTLLAFSLNDTIYEVTRNGAKPKYLIDYGNNRIPEEVLSKRMDDIVNFLSDKNIPGFISNLIETSEYLTFSYTYSSLSYNTVFIQKSSGRITNLFNPANDINYIPFKPPMCTMGDRFVSKIPAYEIVSTYAEISKVKNNSPGMVNIEAYNKLKDIAQDLKEDDNPVLLVYKLK